MIDFNSLKRVTRSNTSKKRGINWRLRRRNENIFTMSQALFDDLDMMNNSMTQMQNETDVFIALNPGNEGVFCKLTAKGKKGKRFKNIELAKALVERDVTETNLDLEYVGNDEHGVKYYRIIPFGSSNAQTAVMAENTEESERNLATEDLANEVAIENEEF